MRVVIRFSMRWLVCSSVLTTGCQRDFAPRHVRETRQYQFDQMAAEAANETAQSETTAER